MLDFLAIVIFAWAYRYVRGDGDLNNDGKKDVPRWAWVAFAAVFCFTASPHYFVALCWFVVCYLTGTLPTHTLFSAIHGNPPARRDHFFVQWMQNFALTYEGKKVGVMYGVFRAMPTFPAFVGVYGYTGNPWVLVLFLLISAQGLAYRAWGMVDASRAVEYSELTIATALAAGVVLCA